MPNLVTNYGAVADGSYANVTFSISASSHTLNVPANTFFSTDTGKGIVIPGAGSGGGPLITSISAVPTTTTITLAAPAVGAVGPYTGYLCWGTTDNSTALNNFTSDYQGQTVTLTVPAGIYYVSYQNTAFPGIANLTINATGATFATGTFQVGANGGTQYNDNAHSARTTSVTAGSNSVQLVTPSQVSIFSVGNWCEMTGFDLQGVGSPTNHHFFEFQQISAIDSNPASPTYGQITFNNPLKNTYLSTWPLFDGGSPSSLDYGGPATLYFLNQQWNQTLVVNGLTVVIDGEWETSVYSATYNNCTFLSNLGPVPTFTYSFNWNSCTSNGLMEVDKSITTMTFTGCTLYSMFFQSSSTDLCILDSCTVTGDITGTPKNFIARNGCTLAYLRPGTAQYGKSDSLTIQNSTVTSFNVPGGLVWEGPSNLGVDHGGCTMQNGLFTYPRTYTYSVDELATNWAVPGSRCMFKDADRMCIGMFTVLETWADVNNIYIQTDWSKYGSGFPPYDSQGGTAPLKIQTHPAPSCTVTSCSGDPDLTALNNSTPGAPLFSYSKQTYTGATQSQGFSPMWGNVISIKANVQTAYSGTDSTVHLQFLGQDDWLTLSDGSIFNYLPQIDCKTTGLRTITPGGGVTGSTGTDSIAALPQNPIMMSNWVFGFMVNDISSENPSFFPTVTVEVITDQGRFTPIVGCRNPKGKF